MPRVWVRWWSAPGGVHLIFGDDGRLRFDQGPPVHGVRPSIDVLLHSLPHAVRAATVVVMLTGMGADGADGAEGVARAGGYVIAEHESSCVIYGMPRAVVERRIADEVVPSIECPAPSRPRSASPPPMPTPHEHDRRVGNRRNRRSRSSSGSSRACTTSRASISMRTSTVRCTGGSARCATAWVSPRGPPCSAGSRSLAMRWLSFGTS